jgi:hypothetical protein
MASIDVFHLLGVATRGRIDSHVRTVEHVFAHEDLLSDTFLWFDRTDVMPSFIIIIFFHREDPDFRTGDDHSVVTTLQ